MHDLRWPLAGALALGLPIGCATPCIDDGLGQDACPPQSSASDTEGSTDTTPSTMTQGTVTNTTMTNGMSDSQTSGPTDTEGTAEGTADETATDTGGMVWCRDADGDGYGDPDDCQPSDEPVDGSVPNGDDCDDSNPNTFPGAAPNDDPDACMQDDDGDDWGDDEPPGGVEPGSDCDDDDASAFPGAAPNENPPDLCTVDGDGDGWGDASPGGGGPDSGSDCYDTNADLNPSTLQLTAFRPYYLPGDVSNGPRSLVVVDPTDASLTPFVTLQSAMGPPPNQLVVTTATMSGLGEIVVNDRTNRRLYSLDYSMTCMMDQGVLTPLGMSYDMDPSTSLAPEDIVCGLEFGPDGGLYGIDFASQLLEFDTATGQIIGITPLTGVTIDGCGMAFDCTEDRLLVANGMDDSIYAVDIATGNATVLRDLGAELMMMGVAWSRPTGLEYDPVTRHAHLSVGDQLVDVDLDPMAPAPTVLVGAYGEPVSNLQYVPVCM